jgi:hypothetical protein
MKSYSKDIHWRRITHGGVHPSSVLPQPHVSMMRGPMNSTMSSNTFRNGGSAPIWYEKWHDSPSYDSPVPTRYTTYLVDELHTDLLDRTRNHQGVDEDEVDEGNDKERAIRHGCWNDLMKKSTDKQDYPYKAKMMYMKRPSLDATETYLTEDSFDEINKMDNDGRIGHDIGKDGQEQIQERKQMQLVDMEICLEDENRNSRKINSDAVDNDDFDLISTASASSSSFSMSDNFDDFDNNLHDDDEIGCVATMIGSDDHFASIFNEWDADDCTATVIDEKVPSNIASAAKATAKTDSKENSSKKNEGDDNASISSSFLSLTEPAPFNMPPLLPSSHWNHIDIPSTITTESSKSTDDDVVGDVVMSLMETDNGNFDGNFDDDNDSIDLILFDDENDTFSYAIDESKQKPQKSFNDLFEERRSQLAASMAASRRTRDHCFVRGGHVKRHASLSHILRDIERSSHVVARNIVLHNHHHQQHPQSHHNKSGGRNQQQ